MNRTLLSRKGFVSPAMPNLTPKGCSNDLRIGKPNDAFEQEAKMVADQIMAGGPGSRDWSLSKIHTEAPLQRKCDCGGAGECEECKEKREAAKTLRRLASGPHNPAAVPSIVGEVLRSPGLPLDQGTRAFFESRFGHDFGKVRVHTDSKAAKSAVALSASAYTGGSNVVFAHGQYAPGGGAGRHLLAHELAHVVQQTGGATRSDDAVLARDSSTEREAEEAGLSAVTGGTPSIKSRIPAWQIGRVEKPGSDASSSTASDAPGRGSSTASPGGATPPKPERLRFDIIGADLPLVNFLAQAAGHSRDPDLYVKSLNDMIKQLEERTPGNSGRCVEHISIFNHGRPGHQLVAGGVEKKGDASSVLRKSYLSLDWLYEPANQPALARLRSVFCCGASMDWLGCGVAGVEAYGGKRGTEEISQAGKIGKDEKESVEERYKDYGDRYQSEEEAQKHGASLQGATFGKVTVGTWADATCTSIRAATDFVFFDAKTGLYRPGFLGKFLEFKPSSAGQCTCDPTTGRVQGNWDPGKGIEVGDTKWQADLAKFNQVVNPSSGSPDLKQLTQRLLELLADVASDLKIPAGLPVGPKPEPWIDPASANPNFVARTYDHLVFCYPNDCWKWIGLNRMVIQQTPTYTRTTLDHELQHAADMFIASFEYKLVNGPPPPAPTDACKPGYKPVGSDPYGKYVLDFRKYYNDQLSGSRHLEIFATSGNPNFQRLTPEEKLAWFSAMVAEVPPDILPTDALPTEPLIANVFQNPLPYEAQMRVKFEAVLYKVVDFFIYGDDAERGRDLGKAKTLVNHFGPVWTIHPTDRGDLAKAIRTEERIKSSPAP